jgi:small subunit ribosomal protein S30e
MPGSHGSLTKAGKVRQATPKVPRTGINSHSKKCPRIRNRKLYIKRVIQNKFGGQANSMSAQKHNRAAQPEKGDRPERGSRRRRQE